MKPTIATHVLVGALGLFGSTGWSAQEPKPQSLPYWFAWSEFHETTTIFEPPSH